MKRLEGARDGDACSDMTYETRDIDEYVHSTRSICVVYAKICVVHTNICVVYTAISGDLIVCVHCCCLPHERRGMFSPVQGLE